MPSDWTDILEAIRSHAAAKSSDLPSTSDPKHHRLIDQVHPSPLSAYKGLFTSRPFTKANDLLGADRTIDWGRTS